MTTLMRRGGLPAACCGRWIHFGSFSPTMASSPQQPGRESLAVWRPVAEAILGTAGGKGNRWVERLLSLKETCRLHARATYAVLVDAVNSLFHGHQPDLSWLNAEVSTSPHPL